MGIVAEDVDRVRAATDFVALASEHISLRRVGREYTGLCPFHAEKSGSFAINPDKGVYYCFGCQAKGDAIDFVRNLEHLDFAQAVERLAARAGITLRYDDAAQGRDNLRKARLFEVMERAVAFYAEQLNGKSPGAISARKYLRGRGYDGDAVRHFSIGWAPDTWDALVKALNLSADLAEETGLGSINKIGKLNDFFRARILFPIFDVAGKPVAFGGRKLPDGEGPKYRNSRETKLYRKSEILYGLNWAKAGIVEAGEVIVCEGYTDVIGFHRAGLARAVATCGTALADDHFRILKNFARRIVLAYDADAAGQNAASKFYEWERKYPIDLYVVALPEGTDPADMARADPAGLAQAVRDARRFLGFRIERILSVADLSSPEGRARAFEDAAVAIWEHPNELVREDYLRQVADRCRVSEVTMARALAERPSQRGSERGSEGHGSREPRAGRHHERSDDPPPPSDDDSPAGNAGPAGNRGQPRRPPGQGRATSLRTLGDAAAGAQRIESEMLRWIVHDPDAVPIWPHAALFADSVNIAAFHCLAETAGQLEAIEMAQGLDDPNADAVELLLFRLSVEHPTNDADDVLAQLVSAATMRAITVLGHLAAEHPDAPTVGLLRRLHEALQDPDTRYAAVETLVPWLESWGNRPTQENQ